MNPFDELAQLERTRTIIQAALTFTSALLMLLILISYMAEHEFRLYMLSRRIVLFAVVGMVAALSAGVLMLI